MNDITKYYEKSFVNIIDILAKTKNTDIRRYQKELESKLISEFDSLNKYGMNWIEENISKKYKAEIDSDKGHKRHINKLIDRTQNDLLESNDYVLNTLLRTISDIFKDNRDANLIQNLLGNQLIDNGIKNKLGYNIASYVQTLSRTALIDASNTAIINVMKSENDDLVQISSHITSCPICLAYQGKIYSISGQDKRFPKLSSVYGTYKVIHPNCRHVLLPYIERLKGDNEIKQDIKFSNSTSVPKDKSKLDQYYRIQQQRQDLRNNKLQWLRYKLLLPNETPKTLNGFIKLKNNEEKFSKLHKSYIQARSGEDAVEVGKKSENNIK